METLHYGQEYQEMCLSLMTNAGLLGFLDVHDTLLHIQKLYHQMNTINPLIRYMIWTFQRLNWVLLF